MLIHVTCPNCSEPYDIADTFAGGVYRCTKCNTLMSVPKPHAPPAATKLAAGMGRAASPDEIETRGSSQPSKASSSTKNAGSKALTKALPKAPAKKPAKPGQKEQVPLWVEYKWHLVSLAGMIVLALVVWGITKAIKGKKVEVTNKVVTVGPRAVSNYVFPYKMGVLTNDKPNVLGLPLTGNVAVVIDGGSELGGVRPALHKLITAGLCGKPYEKPLGSVVYATGDASPPSLKAFANNAPDAAAKLADFFAKAKLNPNSDATAALKPAIKLAIDQIGANQTRHIVVIVGRNLTSYTQNQLASVIDTASTTSTRVDLVVIDADSASMGDLTDQITKMRGTTLSTSATALQTAANGLK